MTPFTTDQWIILILVFLLGLLIGMFVMAGNKWKRRYRDEVRAREELERENERLRREAREMDTLRSAAVRNPPPDSTRGPL